jgi:hypothetical protein
MQGHLIRYDVAKLQDMAMKKVCENRIETRCQNHELMKELASANWATRKAIITTSRGGSQRGEKSEIKWLV